MGSGRNIGHRKSNVTTNMSQWQVLEFGKFDIDMKLINELNLCSDFTGKSINYTENKFTKIEMNMGKIGYHLTNPGIKFT